MDSDDVDGCMTLVGAFVSVIVLLGLAIIVIHFAVKYW